MFSRSLMVWWRGFLDVQVATPARQSPPKGEIPASSLTRGGELKRFCSERPGGLLATSETRESNVLGPRRPDASGYTWWRGGGLHSHSDLPSPPFGGFFHPGALPGRLRGENNVVFTTDRQAAGGCQSAIRRALLSDALPSVDVAGVEPARLGGF